MAIIVNGVSIPANADSIRVNGILIDSVTCNGVTVWQKQKYYYVIFSGNGATSGNMAQQTMPVGVATRLNDNSYGRTGYSFYGWSISSSGGRVYTNGQVVTDIASAGATKTLYALWQAITYYIQFNGNGADDGRMYRQEILYDTSTALAANAYTRLNYNFVGWATSPSGAKVYDNQQKVLNLKPYHGDVVNLYALWKQIQGDNVVSTDYLQFGSEGYYSKATIWTGIDTATYRGAKIKIAYAEITQNFAGYGVIVYLSNGTDNTEIARAYREASEGDYHNNIGYTPGMEVTLNFTSTSGLVDLYAYGAAWPDMAGAGNGKMYIHTSQITLLAR